MGGKTQGGGLNQKIGLLERFFQIRGIPGDHRNRPLGDGADFRRQADGFFGASVREGEPPATSCGQVDGKRSAHPSAT